jgi:hypothetical protein
MSKRTLKNRVKTKNVGKTMGRSHGEMVYNDVVGRMVSPKMDNAIKKNRSKS